MVLYSQVNLEIEERILDNAVSRTFVYVKASINPFTYRFVKKHIKHFKNDPFVQHIMNQGKYKNFESGFESHVHGSEYISQKEMRNARKILIETRKAVIRMHQFVMDKSDNKILI